MVVHVHAQRLMAFSWPCWEDRENSTGTSVTHGGHACRYGKDVSVLEMDGQFDNLEELIYVESHLSNTSAKFYGEITQQMLSNSSFPGSQNGTGARLLMGSLISCE